MSRPEKHFRQTAKLARALKPKDVFKWLVTEGYFPEPYVLPPCFFVRKHPSYGRPIFDLTKEKLKLSELVSVHFPKTDWTDRTFGIIDPELHHDIAITIAKNWKTVVRTLFDGGNRVFAYSFPIPVNARKTGKLGRLRAGRLIYEFIGMAEEDLAGEAYRFRCLLRTDVKNFYPSIYTHSLAWALHTKKKIRKGRNRYDPKFVGNRLDRLFQNANDGCTNGLPIGPAVADLAAELILASVDRDFSRRLNRNDLRKKVLVVRFKDDYRILAANPEAGRSAIKQLQSSLKEFKLELNDEKTQSFAVPDGLFRPWVSEYHAINPQPKSRYTFKRFREVYLGVIRIDRSHPGTGVIDRFFADLVTPKERLRVSVPKNSVENLVSMILMLARLRTKSFPNALGILEIVLKTMPNHQTSQMIGTHLDALLAELTTREEENTYLISWIGYFMRTNQLEAYLGKYTLRNPIARASFTSRFTPFKDCKQFTVFEPVKSAGKRDSLHRHLSVFSR